MPGPLLTEVIADLEEELTPTRTYKLNFETKRITESIDGVEASRQYVYKVLSTERASFAIYGTDEGINYGVELQRFIGRPFSFISSDIERTVSEALLQDERILAIKDFVIGEPINDTLEVSFTVSTLYGDIKISEEATI